MAELRKWNQAREELLFDSETAKEYEELRPQYEVISQIIKVRDEQGITQQELAERTGIKQSNISRFEGGNYNPSLEFLARIARGLGMELHIELRPGR
ncbi:MAG: helix-turn-helix transcriptional regulator [Lachnospiraceae bacterium]|nr:helix-turn-helix transcriptional regulator [Lachnospiraceae bacterium]